MADACTGHEDGHGPPTDAACCPEHRDGALCILATCRELDRQVTLAQLSYLPPVTRLAGAPTQTAVERLQSLGVLPNPWRPTRSDRKATT